ncbi:unnamed protein product, partial [Rotaria sp. Silwood1]
MNLAAGIESHLTNNLCSSLTRRQQINQQEKSNEIKN